MDAKINIPNTLVQTPICDPKTGIVNEHWVRYLLTQFQYISLIKTAKNGRRVEIDATDCIKVYDADGNLIAQFGGTDKPFYLHYEDGGNTITLDNTDGLKIVESGVLMVQMAPGGDVRTTRITNPANGADHGADSSFIGLSCDPNSPYPGIMIFAVFEGDYITGVQVAGIQLDQWGISLDGDINFNDNYFDVKERAVPDAPAADTARLFVQDNGAGKSQLCVRFHTGAVQILAEEP